MYSGAGESGTGLCLPEESLKLILNIQLDDLSLTLYELSSL